MKPQQKGALRRHLARFEQAVRDDAFSGAGHPEDAPFIEQELKEARAALVAYVERISK